MKSRISAPDNIFEIAMGVGIRKFDSYVLDGESDCIITELVRCSVHDFLTEKYALADVIADSIAYYVEANVRRYILDGDATCDNCDDYACSYRETRDNALEGRLYNHD